MSGRDWLEILRELVPVVLWLAALSGLVAGVVALVALIVGSGVQ